MTLLDKWITQAYLKWSASKHYMSEESAYRVGFRDGTKKLKDEAVKLIAQGHPHEKLIEKLRQLGEDYVF